MSFLPLEIIQLIANKSDDDTKMRLLLIFHGLRIYKVNRKITKDIFENDVLKYLKHLNASESKIDDKIILSLNNLVSLDASLTCISDKSIIKHKNLRVLKSHNNNYITDKSVCKLTKLVTLIPGRMVRDVSIAKLKNLETLDASYNSNITLSSVSKLPKLKNLSIKCNPNFRDDELLQLPQLEFLNANSYITDISLSTLTNLKKLSICHLSRETIITTNSIRKLINLENLKIVCSNVKGYLIDLTDLKKLTFLQNYGGIKTHDIISFLKKCNLSILVCGCSKKALKHINEQFPHTEVIQFEQQLLSPCSFDLKNCPL